MTIRVSSISAISGPRRWVRHFNGGYVPLGVISLLVALPLVWIFIVSFKTDFDAIHAPASPIPNPFTPGNYAKLANGQQPVLQWFLNSLTAASLQMILILVTASLGAYALARLDFRGKNLIFAMVVATLLIPPVILLIPNYLFVDQLGWLNTLLAVIVPGAASAFGIFFLRQFFVSLPIELEEAARIDGAGHFRIFFQIVLPLSRPALGTLALLSFLTNWNDLLWPLYVLISPGNFTLPPGLSVLAGSFGEQHFGVVAAGAIVASVPVLVVFGFAQRQVVDSVASTGIRG